MTMGILPKLRDVVPIRPLSRLEALRVAELQATKLLELSGVREPPVPEAIIAELARIQRISPSPVAGAAEWSHSRWLIVLNGADVAGSQRFSLAHEFKHVLDHPFVAVLYPEAGGMSREERAEQVCDYFAGCLLMPRDWLVSAWSGGMRDLRVLSQRFGVSRAAMAVRLSQVGLDGSRARCEVA